MDMRSSVDSGNSVLPKVRDSLIRLLFCLLALAWLSGCTGEQWRNRQADTYSVRAGDTVYGIAWRYGLDYRELARWNRLSGTYNIYPGQVLVLRPRPGTARINPSVVSKPATAAAKPVVRKRPPAKPAPDWQWPVNGKIISAFGSDGAHGKGIDIVGKAFTLIRATASGTVVYSGSGLIGYGQLIIIKHNNTFLSAYGHNSELLVSAGDKVSKGQQIARMGKGPGKRPMLHFEIRIDGKPVDPIRFLPAR
jgi:lipoprotein NlpD